MSSSNPLPDLPPLSTNDSRSSISAIPMRDLEPSPVDDDDEPSPWDPSLPQPNKPSSSSSSSSSSTSQSTNFLGLTPARTIHTLLTLQKYSTLGPAVYLTMHYTNTAIIPLVTRDIHTSDNLLLLTRPYYQSFPLESLLIFIPVAAHVLSGVALRIYRRRQNAKRHGAYTHRDRQSIKWPTLSATSMLGYVLYPMLAAHVLVNRITPLKADGGSSSVGLRYFAHGISKHPLLTNAGYVTMLAIASWHFVSGAAKYLRLSPEFVRDDGWGAERRERRKRRRGRVVNGVAALVATVWIAGGLGVVGNAGKGVGWEARKWDEIYRAVPGIGRWL